MKITRIDTIGFVRSMGMANSFLSLKHKLEYLPDMQCYCIDDMCLLPLHRIAEVTIESDEIKIIEVLKPTLSDIKESVKELKVKRAK